MVLGITGRYCSGKSTVGSLLQEEGWHVIEVDSLGHQALHRLQDEVVEVFGKQILEGEAINREKLGDIVFSDPRKRLLLEGLIHPWMKEECRRLIEGDEKKAVPSAINAALLQYMGLDELCDHVLYVHSPKIFRFYRSKFRDGTSFREFLQREGAQKHIHVYNIASKGSVFYLSNIRGRKYLQKQLHEVLHLLREKG